MQMNEHNEHTVRPDAKGRITLGALAKGVSSFRVIREKSGWITLKPFAEVPAEEAWLYANPAALRKVRRGLAQSARGETVDRGDFTRFAHDN